jgi:hypothetical protein
MYIIINHGLLTRLWAMYFFIRSISSCHHFPRSHPFLHVITEHRAHVDQYEQHTRDAQCQY